MPINKTTTITRTIETELTETRSLTFRVDQFTVRANGPDAGELFGHTSMLDGDEVISEFDWVVPPNEAMPPAINSGLYALLQSTLYSFPQTTTNPVVATPT